MNDVEFEATKKQIVNIILAHDYDDPNECPSKETATALAESIIEYTA
jgi:hypothetical protein